MSTDDPTTDPGYEAVLNDHYGAPELGSELLEALDRAGKDVDALTRDDIASFDEFHIRGRAATRELASLAEIDAGARVIDVGCGLGGPARTLAAERGCEVVGVDLVEAYCRAATLFSERVGMGDAVRFRRANALDLPFDGGTFDVAWFEHVLMNVEAKGRAFAEAARVLAPGGTLAMYEICAGTGGDPVFPVPWASDASLSFLEPPDRVRELVTDQGFAEVVWRDVTEPSLEWFEDVVATMRSRPADAPPPLGLNLLMGERSSAKAENVVRNLDEGRIAVVQGVFERTGGPSDAADRLHW